MHCLTYFSEESLHKEIKLRQRRANSSYMKCLQHSEKKKFLSVSIKKIILHNKPLLTIFISIGFNPRHVRRIIKDKHIDKPIFSKWQKDSPEVVTQMFSHDRAYWSIEKEC